jgi:glycosyltransferase involved in cell wall biosynthesis
MRWLLLCTHVPPSGTGGGMVRYAVELARALGARPDVELHVLARPDSRTFFTDLLGRPDRVCVVPAGLPVLARSVLERHAWLPVLRRSWDVVQGCKHLLPHGARGRRVLTVHDMILLDRPGDFPRLKRTLLVGPYLAAIREAQVIVCVSAATRARLLAYVPQVAPRIRVVPNAVSPTLHRVPAEPVPALRRCPFALVVGDPSPRKNVRFVVDLWPRVVAVRPDAQLVIVGPGWGAGSRRSTSTGTRDGVVRLGHLPEPKLRWCYQNAAVVLCPSRLEGFGLPAVEALELGAPVVTSTDPALLEVSRDHARHLPPDDTTVWVRAIVEALCAWPERGTRPRPARWTWDDVAAETVRAARGEG